MFCTTKKYHWYTFVLMQTSHDTSWLWCWYIVLICLMMLSVYVHHLKDDYQQVFYQVSVCVQSSPSVWQLSLSCDINYLLTNIPFQHLMYRITAVYLV